ncbi:MAG: EF-P lysine aminoacylase EpmA [Pseudomonadota bacterium]
MSDWRPTAGLEAMAHRARLLAAVRAFFAARGVLELEVPLLGRAGVTDPHIDNLEVAGRPPWYLQSSPEYFLKRWLAVHPHAVYYLGKAFRAGERGRLHHPEFTLLEWYRPGWDDDRLIGEVAELLAGLGAGDAHRRLDYGACFAATTGLDPHAATADELRARAAAAAGQPPSQWADQLRATCLDLLFSLAVQPELPAGVVFVTRYPACQAALARIADEPGRGAVARRFEVFLDRIELGNGYWELTDAGEQRRRFARDLDQRRALGRPLRAPDARLLAALRAGLPPCAGVALGIDRLLMALLDARHIREVLAFAEE